MSIMNGQCRVSVPHNYIGIFGIGNQFRPGIFPARENILRMLSEDGAKTSSNGSIRIVGAIAGVGSGKSHFCGTTTE